MSSIEEITGDSLAFAASEKLHAKDRVAPAWGIELLEVRLGFARMRMPARRDMMNGHAIVHGGIIFALADTTLAHAANSHNAVAMTQQASIVFLSPVREGEVLIAEAKERSAAGRSRVYDVEVRAGESRVVAILLGLTRTTGASIVN